MSDNRITLEDEYKDKYFKLPKALFTNEKYKDVSNNAKVSYAILRDRSDLSKTNKWYEVNEEGKRVIYFVYTNDQLMKILNIKSKTTIANIKKELEKAGLIKQKRTGLNKPNKIFLCHPEISESDIEKIDEMENYDYDMNKKPECHYKDGSTKNGLPNAQTIDTQGSTLFGRPENGLLEVQKMDSNETEISETIKIDTLDTLDTTDTKNAHVHKNDFVNFFTEKENEQLKEKYMEKAFYENYDRVSMRIAKMLKVFSRSPEEAKQYYNVILSAKHSSEKATDSVIWLEHEPELEHKIILAFSRAIRKIERERNVQNANGYIYRTIYELLIKEIAKRQRNYNVNDENNSLFYNWLEE